MAAASASFSSFSAFLRAAIAFFRSTAALRAASFSSRSRCCCAARRGGRAPPPPPRATPSLARRAAGLRRTAQQRLACFERLHRGLSSRRWRRARPASSRPRSSAAAAPPPRPSPPPPPPPPRAPRAPLPPLGRRLCATASAESRRRHQRQWRQMQLPWRTAAGAAFGVLHSASNRSGPRMCGWNCTARLGAALADVASLLNRLERRLRLIVLAVGQRAVVLALAVLSLVPALLGGQRADHLRRVVRRVHEAAVVERHLVRHRRAALPVPVAHDDARLPRRLGGRPREVADAVRQGLHALSDGEPQRLVGGGRELVGRRDRRVADRRVRLARWEKAIDRASGPGPPCMRELRRGARRAQAGERSAVCPASRRAVRRRQLTAIAGKT